MGEGARGEIPGKCSVAPCGGSTAARRGGIRRRTTHRTRDPPSAVATAGTGRNDRAELVPLVGLSGRTREDRCQRDARGWHLRGSQEGDLGSALRGGEGTKIIGIADPHCLPLAARTASAPRAEGMLVAETLKASFCPRRYEARSATRRASTAFTTASTPKTCCASGSPATGKPACCRPSRTGTWIAADNSSRRRDGRARSRNSAAAPF